MSYRQKLKANIVLVEKNEKIALQNKQLIGMNDRVSNINKEFQQSRHELMVSNNSKNRFFSILAHDLKNPLHTITGFSFLLSSQYDKLEENERMQYSRDIYNSCIQLNRLLENLLEWSRTQTNEIVFNPTMIDIKQVVDNVVIMLEPIAREKSIEVVNEIERPKVLKADVHMLETIFRNLINNGIKFTKRGGRVSIDAEFKNNNLIVRIADNGIGINKPELRKIFRLESKTRSVGTENEKGTGLGLVICKEFVLYHGGKIYVESVVNKGSVFFVELPFEPHRG
jgi:signal transduction histidine kinase